MKTFLVIITFLVAGSCRAQEIVQTPVDLKKLEINQHQYIGKSMSFLLKDIKPTIKYVSGSPGQGVRPNRFIFSFVPLSDRDKYRKKGKFPPTIIVYVKESFEWYESRKKLENAKRFEWSKEDEVRYGNLTVDSVAVLYENETLDWPGKEDLLKYIVRIRGQSRFTQVVVVPDVDPQWSIEDFRTIDFYTNDLISA